MSREREAVIVETLGAYVSQPSMKLVQELLMLRRRRHRDKLESAENPDMRGRAKECKDLLQLFS